MLTRQSAAAVGVGTCWPWETAAALPSARRRKALRRPRGQERGGAYRGGHPPTARYNVLSSVKIHGIYGLLATLLSVKISFTLTLISTQTWS